MATAARGHSRRKALRQRGKKVSPGIDEEFWKELVLQIRSSRLIPIISNSVRNDYILDSNFDGDVDNIQVPGAAQLTVEEELATDWAEEIGYPLPDNFKLARVAQFNRVVKSLSDEYAKSKYLNFLKEMLLQIASNDETVLPIIESEKMWDRIEDLSFSHIAHELGYPKFNDVKQDSLRTLAKLPLPIYVTTSYYSFLERVLQGEGKLPQIQVCFCSDELPANLKEEHKPNPNLEPTVERPLVFHLFGVEDYPKSLVLSEDDYFDFLVEFSKQLSDVKSSNQPPESRIIPPYLQGRLARSPLLLLGYRPQDWDFRVLFRGIIISAQETVRRDFGVAIQFDPEEQEDIEDAENAQAYLEKYFGKADFKVRWGNTDSFIKELWRAWHGQKKGGKVSHEVAE